MAANDISPDKVVGSYFSRHSRTADISGNVPSDHMVTKGGRKGRRRADKVKIHNDGQFKGRAFKGNGSTIQAESASINPGVVTEVRMKVVFKLNDLNNQTICSWNGNSTQYVILNLDTTGFFEVTRRNSASQYDSLTSTVGQLNHWYEVDLIITPTSYTISIDGVEATQTGLPLATPAPNGNFVLCGFRTTDGAKSTASIASFQAWLDGIEKCNYLIEEQQGSSLFDYSSNANHAIMINTVDQSHFLEEGAIPFSHLNQAGYNTKGVFNGTSDYLDLGLRTELEIVGDISFGAWLRIDNAVTEGVVISKYGFGAIDNRAWQLRITSGLLEVYITDDGTLNAGHYKRYQAIPGFDVTDGAWHFVVATFEAAGSQLKVFVDNIESNVTKSQDDAITSIASVNQTVYIGAIDNGAPVTFLQGELRGVFVYDRVLSSSEIAEAISPLQLPDDYILFEEFADTSVTSHVPGRLLDTKFSLKI